MTLLERPPRGTRCSSRSAVDRPTHARSRALARQHAAPDDERLSSRRATRDEPRAGRLERGDRARRRRARPSFSTDGSVTSAVTGPIRTRTRLPTCTTERISPRSRSCAESACVRVADRDLPRVDDDPDRPLGPRRSSRSPRRSRARSRVRPSPPGARDPAQQVRAGERRDEPVGRAARRAPAARRAGAARPSTITPTLSASDGGVLVVVRDEQRRQPELAQELLQLAAHRDLRVRVERRERLVEQQHARVARERAGERDALPLAARELGRPRLREVRDPEALEVLVGALRARRRRRSGARVMCGKSAYSWKTSPTRRSSGLRKSPRSRVEPDVVVERDPSGRGPHEARRPRAAPTSSRRPTARRARPSPRPRARASSANERSGSRIGGERRHGSARPSDGRADDGRRERCQRP